MGYQGVVVRTISSILAHFGLSSHPRRTPPATPPTWAPNPRLSPTPSGGDSRPQPKGASNLMEPMAVSAPGCEAPRLRIRFDGRRLTFDSRSLRPHVPVRA